MFKKLIANLKHYFLVLFEKIIVIWMSKEYNCSSNSEILTFKKSVQNVHLSDDKTADITQCDHNFRHFRYGYMTSGCQVSAHEINLPCFL